MNVAPRKVDKERTCDVRFVDVDRSNADVPVCADVVAEPRPLQTRKQRSQPKGASTASPGLEKAQLTLPRLNASIENSAFGPESSGSSG